MTVNDKYGEITFKFILWNTKKATNPKHLPRQSKTEKAAKLLKIVADFIPLNNAINCYSRRFN